MDEESVKALKYINKRGSCTYDSLKDIINCSMAADKNDCLNELIRKKYITHDVNLFYHDSDPPPQFKATQAGKRFLSQRRRKRLKTAAVIFGKVLTVASAAIGIIVSIVSLCSK